MAKFDSAELAKRMALGQKARDTMIQAGGNFRYQGSDGLANIGTAMNAEASMSEHMKFIEAKRKEQAGKQLTPEERAVLTGSDNSGIHTKIRAGVNYGGKVDSFQGPAMGQQITNGNYGFSTTQTQGQDQTSPTGNNGNSTSTGSSFNGTVSMNDPNRIPMGNELGTEIRNQMGGMASNALLNGERMGANMIARANADAAGQMSAESFARGNYGQGAAVQAQQAINETGIQAVGDFAGKVAEARSAEQQNAMDRAQKFLEYGISADNAETARAGQMLDWYEKLKATNPTAAAEIRDKELNRLLSGGFTYTDEMSLRDIEANRAAGSQNEYAQVKASLGSSQAGLWRVYRVNDDGTVTNRTTGKTYDSGTSTAVIAEMAAPGALPGVTVVDGKPTVTNRGALATALHEYKGNAKIWDSLSGAIATSGVLDVPGVGGKTGQAIYGNRTSLKNAGFLDENNYVVPGQIATISVGTDGKKIMAELISYEPGGNAVWKDYATGQAIIIGAS